MGLRLVSSTRHHPHCIMILKVFFLPLFFLQLLQDNHNSFVVVVDGFVRSATFPSPSVTFPSQPWCCYCHHGDNRNLRQTRLQQQYLPHQGKLLQQQQQQQQQQQRTVTTATKLNGSKLDLTSANEHYYAEDHPSQQQPPDQQNTPLMPSYERRRLLEQLGGISLASQLLFPLLLFGPTLAATAAAEDVPAQAVPAQQEGRTIVLTGANSGIGFEACKRILSAVNSAPGATTTTNLVLACRTITKAQDAVNRLLAEKQQDQEEQPGTNSINLIPAECNLASMASIQTFADQLPTLLSGGGSSSDNKKINVLCLNAGISRNTAATDVARTEDGFELTVGTNHFGHFYLNHLLLPMMDPSAGKIVVTASSVHDPASPGGAQGVPATLGNLNGLETQGKNCEMIDGGAFNADKAYKDSKLCNVLFTRELHRRLVEKQSNGGITVNCFTPGLIVSTGLFRDQNPLFTKLFDFAATDLFKVGETPAWGGGCLTYMINDVAGPGGQYYGSEPGSSKYGDAAYGQQFRVLPVSEEAQDTAKAKRFWELSERELGISSSL